MTKWWQKVLFFLGAAAFPVLVLESLARMNLLKALWWVVRDPLMFLTNLCLFAGVCLVLTIFRRHKVQASLYALVCLFCALLGLSNYYKITYRLEPVLVTDLTQMSEAVTVMGGGEFKINVWLFVLAGVATIAAIVLSCIFLKGKGKRTPLRLLTAAVGVALVIFIPTQCTFGHSNAMDRYDLVDHAEHSGCLYTAIASENYRHRQKIDNYGRQTVEEAYKGIQADVSPAHGEKTNIILVLGESFTDQAMLSRYVDFTDTLMPFYEQLMPECLTGMMYVPKVGGGTSESEFEVLTGMRSQYSYNPYTMGLPPINSVASILREKGYTASAIHWHVGVFYNRFRNHAMLGFDSLCTTDTTDMDFTIKGTYISDEDHFDSTLQQMQRTENEDFIFLITMQNHGGYNYSDFREKYGSDTPFTNQFSENTELNLANYCYLLRETDAALEKWIAQLKDYPEPVMLVYFSDHLAPFGKDVFEEIGIPLSGEEVHRVPYFIWSNRGDVQGQQDLYAYQLMPYALELAGLNDDPFFSYVEKLRREGVNQDETYELLSYDAIFGEQYAYKYAGLTPQNEHFQVGGEMDLSGVAAVQFGDRVYFQPLLSRPEQKYTLLVGGAETDKNYLTPTDKDITIQCVLYRNGSLANQSQVLTFHGTDDLLEKAQPMDHHALSVAKSAYTLEDDVWTKGYRVYRSKDSFEAGDTLLLAGDKVLLPTTPEGINTGWEYALDDENRLLISLPIDALNSRSGNDLQDYLKAHQVTLICFE